jgi:cell division protein FtsB
MAERGKKSRKVGVSLPNFESAPEHWLRHIRLSGFAFTVLGLIVLSVVVLAPNLRTIVAQRQEISELKQDVEDGKQSVKDLDHELDRWSDPAYIEAQARQRIYYAYPGEKVYLTVDVGDEDASTDDSGTPISDEIQSTPANWMSSMMSSLVTAGTTDATPEELEKQ